MDIRCTNCGADVPIDERTEFLPCPFCKVALAVDLSGSVLHLCMPPSIEKSGVSMALTRALAKKEISLPFAVTGAGLVYVPFWHLRTGSGRGLMTPAVTPPVEDMETINAPGGDVPFFNEKTVGAARVLESTVVLDEALGVAASSGGVSAKDENLKTSLTHVPFYQVTYSCMEQELVVWVDAVTGEAWADEWPPTPQRAKDLMFAGVAAGSMVVFFSEAYLMSGFWFLVVCPLTAVGIFYGTRSLLSRMGW